MNKNNFISVIICTYNRCESLKDTLDSLLKQECDGSFDWEVIVVDNNSKDKTKEVVESYVPKFSGKLRYVFEPNQGLSYARNRGIKEAKGEIIAFTDDDCLPDNEWLLKINSVLMQDKDVDIILGKAVWEDGNDMYKTKDILRGNGLNMSFRKRVFEDIGYFDTNLGPGSIGGSADDTEFIYRAVKKTKNIKSVEDIVVIHKHRINDKEEIKIGYRDCKAYVFFWLKYAIRSKDKLAFKKIYWAIKSIFADLIKEIRNKNRKRIKLKIAQETGCLVGFVKGLYIWSKYNA